MNLKELAEPFPSSDIEWRIGQAGKKKDGSIWAKVLAYITSRAIMERLDKVCGGDWRNEKPEKITVLNDKGQSVDGFLEGISIKINGEWVTRWDGADCTDIEPLKGGLSGALKRAGVLWGIGRYLYELGDGWAQIVDKADKESHYANCKIKVDGKEEWASFNWKPPILPLWALPDPDKDKKPPTTNGNGSHKPPAQEGSFYDSLKDRIVSGKTTGFRADLIKHFNEKKITAQQLGELTGSLVHKITTPKGLNELGKWIADTRMSMNSDDSKCFDEVESLIEARVDQLAGAAA